jgi:hypothetical protein
MYAWTTTHGWGQISKNVFFITHVMTQRAFTTSDKWVASYIAGLLFLLLASPYAYSLTSNLMGIKTGEVSCPDLTLLTVHAIVYTLIIRLLLQQRPDDAYTSKDKWIVSIVGGVLFLLLASPFLYSVVDGTSEYLFGLNLADSSGCPNTSGLVVHFLAFVAVVRILMR